MRPLIDNDHAVRLVCVDDRAGRARTNNVDDLTGAERRRKIQVAIFSPSAPLERPVSVYAPTGAGMRVTPGALK